MHQTVTGWALLALISSSAILHTLAYPQHVPLITQATSSVRTHNPQYYSNSLPAPQPEQAQERKFAEKSNALKKVALDDIDEIQTNSISDGGFSWSNMLGMLMQMIFNPGTTGPNKSDSIDTDSVSPSPWANLLSMGLKILTAILGGGASSDGIDKVDNGSSPMQTVLLLACFRVFWLRFCRRCSVQKIPTRSPPWQSRLERYATHPSFSQLRNYLFLVSTIERSTISIICCLNQS
ncbi:hypothetical protein HW555_000660 [Spodoptera exigua]|uniref:Uncharacterized protein n=1 Tax=Spodoptera exigua TaxID=7107 RepID=A0A835GUP0_SPOEX|nr:hypothetical protein HW555_000660 [Spodoptera exigua]